jgi:hypothetical protein
LSDPDAFLRLQRLTFNQRVVGSIPTALTNNIKELDEKLLPRKHGWEAHGKQTQKKPPGGPESEALLPKSRLPLTFAERADSDADDDDQSASQGEGDHQFRPLGMPCAGPMSAHEATSAARRVRMRSSVVWLVYGLASRRWQQKGRPGAPSGLSHDG